MLRHVRNYVFRLLLLLFFILLLLVRISSAFCVSVCMIEPKTAETTITKLVTGIVHHESWLAI